MPELASNSIWKSTKFKSQYGLNFVDSDIDECIKNIYQNKNLNKLIDDDEKFRVIIEEIDSKIDLIKESIYYNSGRRILFLLIPALSDAYNSPFETTSAPRPSFFISFNNEILELDFTEKQTKGLISLKAFLKFSIFSLKFL